MHEMRVELGERAYPILLGEGRMASLSQYSGPPERPVLVISDTNVAPLYLERLLGQLGDRSANLVLPAGENEKSLRSLDRIWNRLADMRMPRDGLLVALGGGVIGDMTGFAAATWMRGTPFISLPTTLLAMVDASVGGKTAINLDSGKNLVGAFHQPEAVVIDTTTLATLPDREYAAGVAEVIKSAIIEGDEFLDWLESNAAAVANREMDVVEEVVLRSCRLKATVVAQDEREQGQRALLNLGHTFAHAIETGLGHGVWLHGEAVAAGIVLALRHSEQLLGLDPALATRCRHLFEQFSLPTALPDSLSADQMLELMARDKKVDAESWRLVLVASPGDVRVVRETKPQRLRELLEKRA